MIPKFVLYQFTSEIVRLIAPKVISALTLSDTSDPRCCVFTSMKCWYYLIVVLRSSLDGASRIVKD